MRIVTIEPLIYHEDVLLKRDFLEFSIIFLLKISENFFPGFNSRNGKKIFVKIGY